MNNRIGVVGIVIEDSQQVDKINDILHVHAGVIAGRMGIPHPNGRDVNVISIVVDGTTDDIGSLTGKLGVLNGVSVKSALSKKTY
ncbi:TM1266 family iron-only hydrogenase system putative regulator [Alkalibacter saccharofermentans]|uniref:Putative iron-only hydrogenase system regulator n=1 Tax=Alkalibacter saccharofermentans DSM 14828 TaxID=1120975 RepID=A0A1M4SCG2_9FIRM|nr:TM1266 family iron-only hydrogenase system putative regulator [Alkalibacter saccharofermentans]SHE29906.1 putative iron-only hydrogenase system regulator [Alkalibacter saccharofermentans DSM 14828]